MSRNYRAFRIHQGGAAGEFRAGVEQLPLAAPEQGEVLIQVQYSGVNYKDALAGTKDALVGRGRGSILRVDELNGGIDLAGKVVESASDDFRVGDAVLVNGCGLSETRDGGYAEYARVPADIVVPVTGGLDARRAMIIGTAGFTAAMALHAMQINGQTPERGPIAVTGASGGVGSFALHLFSRAGYDCSAITRSLDARDYLTGLGAREVIPAPDAVEGPMGRARWGGAVDNLGGETLSTLLKTTRAFGNVVSIGLAQSSSLETSMMPFIIRGVNLLGATSANCTIELRRALWRKLGDEWLPDCFDAVLADTVTLDALPATFKRVLAGEVRGRVLVDLAAKT